MRDRQLKQDDGIALVTALLVCLVLLAFGSTAVVLGVNNLRNANGDRQAGSSLGAGDMLRQSCGVEQPEQPAAGAAG